MTPFARRSFGLTATVAGGLAVLACMRATASAEGAPLPQRAAAAPKLVLLITVDQLRGDYLSRWPGQLTKGLGRLTRGAWFTNGFQDHAITETAPGHASPLSGRFPRSTGIVANSAGVIDAKYTLLAGTNEVGASPERFRGTALYDWLAAKDKRSRAFSVSMKDRGAILPIGRAKQEVYWYSTSGAFTTSTYYRDSLPTWVKDFNDRRIPFSYAGAQWRLSRDSSFYKEPDSVAYEHGGRDYVFPHAFRDNAQAAVNDLRTSPTIDSITALLALEGLQRLDLGRGPQTDVMAVSLSGTDYVGHAYGPDSRELHENILRLDETIGWLLDSLYKLRDSSSVVIALTGDHGVSPIPELARERGEATGDQGMRVSLRQPVADVRAGLQDAGVDPEAFLYDTELVGIDRAQIARRKLKADSILDAFASAARQVRGVARVDRLSAIRRMDPATDPIARRWSHQIPENTAVDLVITLTRYSYWGGSVATHGSPYDQDAHVPIIFYGAGVKPGRFTTFARTVDMGPTLAAIVGVRALEQLDGRVLMEAVAK